MLHRYMIPATLLLLATGCTGLLPSADRVEVQQGNLLTAEDIGSIEEGMPRAEVRERLGSPVLGEYFNRNRWDYVYYLTAAGRDTGDVQRLSIRFENDRVAQIDDRYAPPDPPAPEDIPEIEEDQPVPGEPAPGEPAPGEPASGEPAPAPEPGGTQSPTM